MSDSTSIPIRYVSESNDPVLAAPRGPVKTPSYDILVPIPETADLDCDLVDIPRLLRTPLAVAADRGGTVTIASIPTVPSDVGSDQLHEAEDGSGIMGPVIRKAQEHVSTALDTATSLHEDVSVNGFVGVVDVPETAFADLTTDGDYDAIYLGRQTTNRVQLWDEAVISRVLDTVPCAVYVENIGVDAEARLEEVDAQVEPDGHSSSEPITDILLAIGTGPHSVLGAETARALANESGASVRALHLFQSTDDKVSQQKGRKALSLAEYVLSNLPAVESELRVSDDVITELLTEIEQCDVAIIGAPTEKPLLSRLLARSAPDELMSQSTASVITVRQPSEALDEVYYRWKRAVERTSGVDMPPAVEGRER